MKKRMLCGLACFIPVIISLFVWNNIPDSVPIHFGSLANITTFSSKVVAFFVIPSLAYLLHIAISYIYIYRSDWLGANGKSAHYYYYFLMPIASNMGFLFILRALVSYS